jgi:hypothetical protein
MLAFRRLRSSPPLHVLAATPWPLPANLTTTGDSTSIASVPATFTFTCEPSAACNSDVCSGHPTMIAAFARYEVRAGAMCECSSGSCDLSLAWWCSSSQMPPYACECTSGFFLRF